MYPGPDIVAVIDLSRLVTGFAPEAFEVVPDLKEKFIEALFAASEWNATWSLPLPKAKETNILLLFRTLTNIFQGKMSLSGMWSVKVSQ